MSARQWEQAAQDVLAELDEARLLRVRRQIEPIDSTHLLWNGRRYTNFASNDYLGLSRHPRVLDAAADALRVAGVGSGASPLISGYGPAHASAEDHIARWKGAGAAVLLPSGYQANLAAVQTLATVAEKSRTGIRFLIDKLSHASLIDAVRSVGAPFRVFPHNHIGKLSRLLADAEGDATQVVVTESIFSMDGDAAELAEITRLKELHPFVLLLDEAHASGVYGPAGSGSAAELGLQDAVDITVITLSKALGVGGGAVCASRTFCDAMVNLARAYVYSTSVPPSLAAAADAAIGVLQSEPHRQHRVRQLARHIRQELAASGLPVPPGDSPIVPVIMKTESAALEAADSLLEKGFFVLAIRPPTVPRGSSRLRVTLCSEHTDVEVEQLLAAIRELPVSAWD